MKNFLAKIFGKNVSRYYVSPIDQFIAQCDQKKPIPSCSQSKEKKKFSKIAYLRDNELKAKQKDSPTQ